jgi:hypothetical protein
MNSRNAPAEMVSLPSSAADEIAAGASCRRTAPATHDGSDRPNASMKRAVRWRTLCL